MAWKLFGFVGRKAPDADPSVNGLLNAYVPGLAPPTVLFVGAGRLVQRDFSPLEGAQIQLGNGAQVLSTFPSSLGVNDLNDNLQPLNTRSSFL